MNNEQTRQQREVQRLTQVRDAGRLHRTADVVGVDAQARSVELCFSSETEVKRWGWIEVLSHVPNAVRLARLNDGGALLDNHNWNAQRGVVEKAWLDTDRRCRALVRFSKSAAADELFQDVQDRIKRHVSVAYEIHTLKLTEERDGVEVYTATDWEPYEISIVSVPADTTVGIGRSVEIAPEETHSRTLDDARAIAVAVPHYEVTKSENRSNMDETQQQQARETERRAGADAERARVRAIGDMAAKFGKSVENADALARTAIQEGHSEADFQRALLDALNQRAAKPLNEQLAGADIGLSETEVRQYSLVKVIRALVDPTDKRAQREAAFEFEASEAARTKQEKKSERFVVPTDVLRRSVYGETHSRVFNTSKASGAAGNTGGFSIATNLLASSFIDLLRMRATIMTLGRVLGGLVGNIDIPKQVAGAVGYWIGEDEDAGETGIELGQIAMPKTVAAYSEITRRLLMQSSLDVEALVRADLAVAMALTIDKAGYYGTGSANQPLGITGYPGIKAVNFAVAGKPTFSELVGMGTAIATDNADVEGMSYVSNAGFRGYAKTTLKFTNVAGTIWEPGNQVNGYPAQITNQVASGDVFMANYSDFLIGMWGGLELTVDPYTHSKKGRLRIITFQDVDFAVRRVESFCLGRKVA